MEECHNDISNLTRKTDEKVYEQDRKLQELESFRKLVQAINKNYDGLELRLAKFEQKITSCVEKAEHTCIMKNKECQATMRNGLLRVDGVCEKFEAAENHMLTLDI